MGEKFNIHKNFSKQDIANTIKNLENSLEVLKLDVDTKNSIRQQAVRIIKVHSLNTPHMNKFERESFDNLLFTKRFLKENPNIFFTKSGKGNVTVCLNVDDYQDKMKILLNDKDTYTIVPRNPLKILQSKTSKI